MSITYYESVFAALRIQTAVRMCHIVTCGLIGCKKFLHIISKTHDYEKTLLDMIIRFDLLYFRFL
jgi:hypothetical protein